MGAGRMETELFPILSSEHRRTAIYGSALSTRADPVELHTLRICATIIFRRCTGWQWNR